MTDTIALFTTEAEAVSLFVMDSDENHSGPPDAAGCTWKLEAGATLEGLQVADRQFGGHSGHSLRKEGMDLSLIHI